MELDFLVQNHKLDSLVQNHSKISINFRRDLKHNSPLAKAKKTRKARLASRQGTKLPAIGNRNNLFAIKRGHQRFTACSMSLDRSPKEVVPSQGSKWFNM